MLPAVPKAIGDFRIVRELKGGAQGMVYQAVCERDDLPLCPRGTTVALKTMTVQDETHERYARLERRTKELTGLRHRNIVRYLGCFRVQALFSELHAVVLEYLDGETLKERLERNPGGLDADEALRVSVAMVAALAEAEAHGICHRDVKPGNIFLCRNGEVKLIDFEVARLESGSSTSGSGRMVGTFDYMAPDFADPAFRGDYCSDVFSAGVVMHEAIVGRTPYRPSGESGGQADFVFMSRWAKNPDGTFQASAVVLSPKVKRLLAHMDVLLWKALAPERSARFPSFAAFLAELRSVRFRDLISGERVYRILQMVGKGGFGEVFKARDKRTGRLVAVKRLLKAEYAERFHREARIMAQLDDPCFVRFVDFFVVQHGGTCESFLLMDFLEGMPGSSLKDAIKAVKGAGLPSADVLRAFARYAHGLTVMHARGIYHRDIKPANLYYPAGRPEACAIMDFGIARDVNGTETTGGVPGTFDYMPPEVITQQTRGEAAMDIYALGHCLYEALTGKTAYPRLPAGTAAYAKFFQRAKTLVRPNLDGLAMASQLEVQKLIREMTEPDVSLRLSDTREVERRLWELAREASPFMTPDDPAEAATVSGIVRENAEPTKELPLPAKARGKSATRRNAPQPRRQGMRLPPGVAPPKTWRERAVRAVLTVSVLLALAVVAYSQRAHVLQGVSWVRGEFERRRQAKAADAAAANRVSNARRLANAERDARVILAKYEGESPSAEEIDAEFALWLETWAGAVASNDVDRIVSEQREARARRLVQDAARAKKRAEDARREREAEAVVAAYARESVEEGDRRRDQWLKTWRGVPESEVRPALDSFAQARKRRQTGDLEAVAYADAQKAADGVVASCQGETLDLADRKRGLWDSEWRGRLSEEHFAKLSARLDEARASCKKRQDETDRRMQELRMVRDCIRLCETLEPVETRRNRLDDADRMVTEGVAAGIIGEQRASRLRQSIRERRAWTVFQLSNRTDADARVGDGVLASGQTRLFVYTNAVPAGLSVSCKGFEPRMLGRADDGREIRISRSELVAEPVIVTVPEREQGVVCRIDGVRVASSSVRLMPGNHVCTYSRPQSRDQSFAFSVEIGTPMCLAEPEPWQVSDEVKEQNREASRRHEAAEYVRTCRALMQVDPLASRRHRLAECDAKLREWNADAILGTEQMSLLRDELARESARVIGIVTNRTSFVLRVGGSAQATQIPAKTAVRLSFAFGLPEHASLQVKGYEPVELPADFDGSIFAFGDDMLVASPVRIAVPELPDGVTCLVDGQPTVNLCELRPGVHTYTYRKGDCADIRGEFTVKTDTPMTLPPPSGWKESSALSSLQSAWAAMNDGAMDKVERFLEAAEVQSEENMRRKREIQRRVALRKRFVALKDEARACLADGLWGDALRVFADLKAAGYVFSEEELAQCETAYDKGRDQCKTLRESAFAAGRSVDVEKADAELRNLHRWHDVVLGKTTR